MKTPEPATPDRETAIDPHGTYTIAGNRIRILERGEDRLKALLGLIVDAKRSLRLLFYIYADDRAGAQVRDALIAAAERGVHVSLMVDGFGSAAGDRFFAPLEAAGAEVCRFSPRFGRRYLLRNHQKLALADEARVIVGGFNVEDDYFGRGDAWRDLGLLIEGHTVSRLARYYDALVRWASQPKGKLRDLGRLINRWSEKEGQVRWLLGGPTKRLSPWARALRTDLARGKRIDLIVAYFTPSVSILRRIRRARKRGGEVRLVTAAKSDNQATIAAARFLYPRLLRNGVRIYEYLAAKLHTKLFVIDDVVHVGSANFDIRSLFLNMEIMLRIDDPTFAAAMRAYIDGEVAESHEMTLDEMEDSGWLTRIRRAMAYFVVAILDGNITRRLNFGPDGK
ncbi:phosphatidylserine/phosphatidylglycerophosphate/cardiolipin synthase family protein [Sphingomonas naphthae]|uniref:Phospholipase D n=1 Tax=Sphingomonas naphthae TaxID=1813468 RepID=A0ABY7TLN0_9SPHN|nr:phosphatidylserine/phosphatidylglycerophosphate/cardiolipin synthase family protein [Sphingomonas naphthae]WCT73881.1 phosphatidylserine/phosphatidylglycerophosphate/cardiolipin synthase family protein [Sphingomonas naphthae]